MIKILRNTRAHICNYILSQKIQMKTIRCAQDIQIHMYVVKY